MVQYSSYVDCVVHCVSCVTIGLIGFVSDSAPSSSHSSMASSYMDVPFYGLITLRMSTRRLSVMLFVFSFSVTVISCYLLRGVPVVAEEFFIYFRPTAWKLYDF